MDIEQLIYNNDLIYNKNLKRAEKLNKELDKLLKNDEDKNIEIMNRKIEIIIFNLMNLYKYLTKKESLAVIIMILKKKENYHITNNLHKYLKNDNLLLALQVMNKFATDNKIRVEDAISVFTEHVKKYYYIK